MTRVDIAPEISTQTVLGKQVSELQTDVQLIGDTFYGTLNHVTGYTEFDPNYAEGNFLAVKFDATWADYDTVKAYILPSAIPGSEPGNLVTDPDHNAVLKVTDAATQVIKVVATKGTNTRTETYKLIGLTCL